MNARDAQRVRVHYRVPDLHAPGGIQNFALSQVEHLGPGFSVHLEDWPEAPQRRLAAQASARLRRADVVHHWHISSAALRPRGKRSVLTCHGLDILSSTWKSPLHRAAYRNALARVDVITANSTFTLDYLVDVIGVPAARVRTILPGVRTDVPHRADGRAEGPISIGVLARMVPRKGIGRVIEAAAWLRDHGLDVHLQLAGDGPLRPELLDQARRLAVPHTYWGRVTDELKTDRFLPALDVFCLPTTNTAEDVEGFGIVYLEANAAGTPVVATRGGGVADAVSDGVSGRLLESGSVEEVGQALLDVVEAGAALRSTARSWAVEHSVQRTGRQFAALYRELLDERPR